MLLQALCTSQEQIQSRGGGSSEGREADFFFLKEEQKRVFPVGCLPPAAPNWNHQTPAELTSDILSSIEIVNIQEKHSTHKFAFYAIDSTGSHCVPALTEALVQNKLGLIETKLIRLQQLHHSIIADLGVSGYINHYLRGFIIDTANYCPVCLFGPLPLEIGSDNRIQRKSSADGGFWWTSRGSVCCGNRENRKKPGAC